MTWGLTSQGMQVFFAVIASGYSETWRIKEAQKLGAGSYLKKPYLFDAMVVAVRTELDRQIATC